jgi:hypothetical protein
MGLAVYLFANHFHHFHVNEMHDGHKSDQKQSQFTDGSLFTNLTSGMNVLLLRTNFQLMVEIPETESNSV